jgi:putative transposase
MHRHRLRSSCGSSNSQSTSKTSISRNSSPIRQQTLAFPVWGGARRGAGRKRTGARSRVSHRTRPAHAARHPLHVTVRLGTRLPSLRRKAARLVVSQAFAAGCERFGFRLNQFSLQSNHMHLIAEARDSRALSRGMQGLLVRVARALNRLWERRGSVFSDRFHARALRTPREVRSALLYVLQNARHHGLRLVGIDPYSSGPWFDGWQIALARVPGDAGPPATTWLLREGWRRHGLIAVGECPR